MALPVTRGQVDADGVARDVLVGVLEPDPPSALADDEGELELVVELRGLHRVANGPALSDECGRRWLEEEDRNVVLFGERGVAAVLGHVVVVVGAGADHFPRILQRREPVVQLVRRRRLRGRVRIIGQPVGHLDQSRLGFRPALEHRQQTAARVVGEDGRGRIGNPVVPAVHDENRRGRAIDAGCREGESHDAPTVR